MKETELAAKVVEWLSEQHWEVYQEVQFFRGSKVADIVATRGLLIWIIECKTSYGFAVLEQATRWPTHLRSIAIPRIRRDRNYAVAKAFYKVGVIEVGEVYYDGSGGVREEMPAPLLKIHHNTAKRWKEKLTEEHKTFAIAGSRGGMHLTPYKQTMKAARTFIEHNEGCTIREIYEHLGKMHYSSKSSFKGNLLVSLETWEDWCVVDRTTKPFTLYMADH